MEQLQSELVHRLRSMARTGARVSEMLRELTRDLAPPSPHKVTLIKYMREAFCLTLQQASPIAGWAADGMGEIQDAQLDGLLHLEIAKNRTVWDSLDPTPAA